MIRLSVVIPVYNAKKYLNKAIDSVLAQKEVCEVILVDDGSTDGSYEICNEYLSKDNRVKLFFHPNQKNKGAAITRNLGILKSNGTHIAFLDADDFYLENRFETAFKILSKNKKTDGVYEALGVHFEFPENEGNYPFLDENNLTTVNTKVAPNKLFEILIKGRNGYFSGDALVVKKDLLIECGLFDDLKIGEDTLLYLKLALKGSLLPGSINKPVAKRRVHFENTILQSTKANKLALLKVYTLLLNWAYAKQTNPKNLQMILFRYVIQIGKCQEILKQNKGSDQFLKLIFKYPKSINFRSIILYVIIKLNLFNFLLKIRKQN